MAETLHFQYQNDKVPTLSFSIYMPQQPVSNTMGPAFAITYATSLVKELG